MKAVVTRTVKATKANVTVYDKTALETKEKDVILDRVYDEGSEKMTKVINKTLADNEVLININATSVVNSCYGVPVSEFMAIAVELDPVTRKPLNATEE